MQDFLYVKEGSRNVQVLFSDIQYVEVNDKYASLVTPKGRFFILQSLHAIEEILPKSHFCRIHRSYIISLHHTKWFDHDSVCIGNEKLPIGKSYKTVLPKTVIVLSGGEISFTK